jgi:hypothetical protein
MPIFKIIKQYEFNKQKSAFILFLYSTAKDKVESGALQKEGFCDLHSLLSIATTVK